ncbi:hypothetical protein PG996_004498 [Apiospora saccharicola]|uniref:Uncharacterized protein n=1 Tax=Apiospora saccharicola TaxID=335842 RepID=A0ABR1W491_9PEZI
MASTFSASSWRPGSPSSCAHLCASLCILEILSWASSRGCSTRSRWYGWSWVAVNSAINSSGDGGSVQYRHNPAIRRSSPAPTNAALQDADLSISPNIWVSSGDFEMPCFKTVFKELWDLSASKPIRYANVGLIDGQSRIRAGEGIVILKPAELAPAQLQRVFGRADVVHGQAFELVQRHAAAQSRKLVLRASGVRGELKVSGYSVNLRFYVFQVAVLAPHCVWRSSDGGPICEGLRCTNASTTPDTTTEKRRHEGL